MSQIRRRDTGPVAVDAGLLLDMWWTLGMDEAPPRARIKTLADKVRAGPEAGQDPEDDGNLTEEALALREELPVYVPLLEADALQRLRGWHRLRHGTVTVEAAYLCEVRNLLDSLTISLGSSCEEELEALKDEGLTDLAAEAEAAIAASGFCGYCEWCRFLELRDRCDDALDASGHYGSSYYQAYKNADLKNPETARTGSGETPATEVLQLPDGSDA